MSSEHAPTPEGHEAAYEFPIGWGGLIVGVLERKVGLNPTDSSDPSWIEDTVTRTFSTKGGGTISVLGMQFTDESDYKVTDSIWWLTIAPSTSPGTQPRPYGVYVQRLENEGEAIYHVRQRGSSIAIGAEAEEALLGALASMAPSSEAKFLTADERNAYIDDRSLKVGGPVVREEVQS